jgi:hypothetical protein
MSRFFLFFFVIILVMAGAVLAWWAFSLPGEVTFPVGKTAMRTMTAQAHLMTWALPNMYFHITTAYNILRHNGVVIGKGDYLTGSAA